LSFCISNASFFLLSSHWTTNTWAVRPIQKKIEKRRQSSWKITRAQ
jgi:hypothetical protein